MSDQNDRYQHSVPIDPAVVAQYCATTFLVRVTKYKDSTDKASENFVANWKEKIGYEFDGCRGPYGGWVALTYPESLPMRS